MSSWVIAFLSLVLVFLVYARAVQQLEAGKTAGGCDLMFLVSLVSIPGSLMWSESIYVFFFSYVTLICAWLCEYDVWRGNNQVYLERSLYAPKVGEPISD